MTGKSTVSPSRLAIARRADKVIERELRKRARPKAKDTMPWLLKAGVFPRDYNAGKPVRDLLRELDKAGQLDVMRTVRVERKAKKRLWYFELPEKR